MIWLICFFAAAVLFAVSVTLSVVLFFKKRKRSKGINSVGILFGGWAASTVFLNFPIAIARYESIFDSDGLNILKSIYFSIHQAMRAFAIDDEYYVVGEGVEAIPASLDWLRGPYAILAYTLIAIAPILTFGLFLSFFRNINAYIRYKGSFFRDTYVFSSINEKSLALAEDIAKKHPKACVVFTNVFKKDESELEELIGRAGEFGAVCLKRDITSKSLFRKRKDVKMTFFVMGDAEKENICQTLELCKLYDDRENTRLYLFSKSTQSAFVMGTLKPSCLKVRRVNESVSIVNSIIYDEGYKIFDSAKDTGESEKHIGAVVVGLGEYGSQMLRTLSWYCQMDGYSLTVDAFDKDALSVSRLRARCPELLDERFNGTDIKGEARYRINIHETSDVKSAEFANEILKLRNATYVFVALGDDELNISTCVELRMLFERVGAKPLIRAVVYNDLIKDALFGAVNYRGQSYGIEFISDIETEKVIIDSALEAEALSRHLKWGKEEDFWAFEYNYMSSVASALHMRARVHCAIPGADKSEKELTEKERNALELLEHRRWNAYMRSEGYVFSGSTHKSTRNDLAKMHHDLISFYGLSEEEKEKDFKVGTK